MKDILYYINKLSSSTKEGKIPWKKLRDGIFVWQTETSEKIKTNIIVQKKPASTESILFRLYEVDNKRALLDIDTKSTNSSIKQAIHNLYEIIENSQVNYELNILDDLLKNI